MLNPNDLNEKKVVSANRKILQRLIAAKLAGREVDFEKAAAHEALSVPISIFKTDGSMRDGNKSKLVAPILDESAVPAIASVRVNPSDSQHIVDAMFLIHQIKITERIKTFRDFSDKFNNIIYNLPSDRIDVAGDRYDEPSTKDGCRGTRSKPKKGSRRRRKPVEKMITLDLDFPTNDTEFNLFLKVKKNCTKLLNLLGTRLIANAPNDKTIVATGMFEDPEEVRSNKLSRIQLHSLECDHEEADTRVIPPIVRCPSPYSFVVSNDTDTFVALLGNKEHFPNNKTVYLQRGRTDFINVTSVAENLEAKGVNLKFLPLMHALTGCDQTSYLHNVGKVTAFSVYLEHQVRKLN